MSAALDAAMEAYCTFGQSGDLRAFPLSQDHVRAMFGAALAAAESDPSVVEAMAKAAYEHGNLPDWEDKSPLFKLHLCQQQAAALRALKASILGEPT